MNKYDEEIEGRADEGGFRLGGAPQSSVGKSNGGKGKERAEDVIEKEKIKLSLDYTSKFFFFFLVVYFEKKDIDIFWLSFFREFHYRLFTS